MQELDVTGNSNETANIGIKLLGFTEKRIAEIAAGPMKAFRDQYNKLSMQPEFRRVVAELEKEVKLGIGGASTRLKGIQPTVDIYYFVTAILGELGKVEVKQEKTQVAKPEENPLQRVKQRLGVVQKSLSSKSKLSGTESYDGVVHELGELKNRISALIVTSMLRDFNPKGGQQLLANMALGKVERDSRRSSSVGRTETIEQTYDKALFKVSGIAKVKEDTKGKEQILRENITKLKDFVVLISNTQKMDELARVVGYGKIADDIRAVERSFSENISDSVKLIKPFDTGSSEDLSWVKNSKVQIAQLRENLAKYEVLAQQAASTSTSPVAESNVSLRALESPSPRASVNTENVSSERKSSLLPSWTRHSDISAVMSDDPAVKISQINALRQAAAATAVIKSDSVGSVVIAGADFNKAKAAAATNNMRIQETGERSVVVSDDKKNTHVVISDQGNSVSFSAKAPSGEKKEEAVDQMISLAVAMTEKYQAENVKVTKNTPSGDIRHQIMEKFEDKESRHGATYKI
jgi:hypothetical protein